MLSRSSAGIKPGENVFVVEGRLDDPAHRRAYMPSEQVVKTPVGASFDRLSVVRQALEAERSQ